MKLTKIELQNYLTTLQQLALRKKPTHKYYGIAQTFLGDCENFFKVLNKLPDSQNLTIIKQNSEEFILRARYRNLFNSHSIVLLQDSYDLYIYIIGKYKLM